MQTLEIRKVSNRYNWRLTGSAGQVMQAWTVGPETIVEVCKLAGALITPDELKVNILDPVPADPTTPGPHVVAGHPGGSWGSAWREIHYLGGAYSPAFAGIMLEGDARKFCLIDELLTQLDAAVASVQLENEAGNPIMSAWRKDTVELLARARAGKDIGA